MQDVRDVGKEFPRSDFFLMAFWRFERKFFVRRTRKKKLFSIREKQKLLLRSKWGRKINVEIKLRKKKSFQEEFKVNLIRREAQKTSSVIVVERKNHSDRSLRVLLMRRRIDRRPVFSPSPSRWNLLGSKHTVSPPTWTTHTGKDPGLALNNVVK